MYRSQRTIIKIAHPLFCVLFATVVGIPATALGGNYHSSPEQNTDSPIGQGTIDLSQCNMTEDGSDSNAITDDSCSEGDESDTAPPFRFQYNEVDLKSTLNLLNNLTSTMGKTFLFYYKEKENLPTNIQLSEEIIRKHNIRMLRLRLELTSAAGQYQETAQTYLAMQQTDQSAINKSDVLELEEALTQFREKWPQKFIAVTEDAEDSITRHIREQNPDLGPPTKQKKPFHK